MDKAKRKAIELQITQAIQETLKSAGIESSEKAVKLIKSSSKEIVKKATKEIKELKKKSTRSVKPASKKTVAKKAVAKKKSQKLAKAGKATKK